MKKNYDEFDTIDDYYEEEDDANFFRSSIETDLSDVRYEDFNKVNEVEDDDDEYEEIVVENKKTSSSKKSSTSIMENDSFISILSVFWTWFRRIGIVIAVILIAYYITKGMFKDLFLYILMLVVAFFFGFGFMALINKVMENR